MKRNRILLICTLLIGLLLSMTACSGTESEVLPEGFDEYAAQLGLHKTPIPEKLGLSEADLQYDQYSRTYQIPGTVEFYGLSFDVFLNLMEENKMLYSFRYISETIESPKEAAEKLSAISRALAEILGNPRKADHPDITLFHALTAEELEALLAAPTNVAGSNTWSLGRLSTEETAALRSWMVQLNYYQKSSSGSHFLNYPNYLYEPALMVDLFVRCVEDGRAIIQLTFSLEYNEYNLE